MREQVRIPFMTKSSSGPDVLGQLSSLRRYALSLTRQSADAEDLVHDTLVRAYESRASFKSGSSLKSWLLAILHNSFIDGTRRRGADQRRNLAVGELESSTSPPVQEVAVRLAQIRRAFEQLPEEQRAVMHLVAIEELSYQEAGKVLAIPVGTVMSRLSRARETLRAFEAGEGAKPAHLKLIGGKDDRS